MYTRQYLSQESYDLDDYFPGGIDVDDAALYRSVDFLTHSLDFDAISSAHRTDSNPFQPTIVDREASGVLKKEEPRIIRDKYQKKYLLEESRVVPHFPSASRESTSNARSPLSPSRRDSIDIVQKFIVYDATTGRERRPLLHEFMRMVVEDDEFSYIAEYTDRRQDIFKLHKPKEISELWKQVKGRNSDNSK